MPSNADRMGNLIAILYDSNGNTLLTGTVGGPYIANVDAEAGLRGCAGRAVLYFNGCTTADTQARAMRV